MGVGRVRGNGAGERETKSGGGLQGGGRERAEGGGGEMEEAKGRPRAADGPGSGFVNGIVCVLALLHVGSDLPSLKVSPSFFYFIYKFF